MSILNDQQKEHIPYTVVSGNTSIYIEWLTVPSCDIMKSVWCYSYEVSRILSISQIC